MPSRSANGPAAYRRQERLAAKRAWQQDEAALPEMSNEAITTKHINIHHFKRQVSVPHIARMNLFAAVARATRQKKEVRRSRSALCLTSAVVHMVVARLVGQTRDSCQPGPPQTQPCPEARLDVSRFQMQRGRLQ